MRLFLLLLVVFIVSCSYAEIEKKERPEAWSIEDIDKFVDVVKIEEKNNSVAEKEKKIVDRENDSDGGCSACDDDNPCTLDYCDDEKNECIYEKLDGEQNGCSGMRPNTECFVFTCFSGRCIERFFYNCCGNGICERRSEETHDNCGVDCPLYDAEGDINVDGEVPVWEYR